ncbi:MAG: AraC family transcriptional regulator [Oscillospiraceae bacterium]|nr:AraC family transcriptional regulator [Oscillospiraceae bacterium]
MGDSDKKGYLNEAFRLFHLCDTLGGGSALHYHDFDKLVFFLSGDVRYYVDGNGYPLRSGDLLLVRRYSLHRAEIGVKEPYERVIVYIGRDFEEKNSTESTRLRRCFDRAAERGACLIRPDAAELRTVRSLLMKVEEGNQSEAYGADVLACAALTELLVYINRKEASGPADPGPAPRVGDERIGETLRYISEHLTDDLSVGALAARCYFSRYHFMRLFREATGETVHEYVRGKRLMNAARLIMRGEAAGRAASESGFGDYSAFERAFKREFGCSPSRFRESGIAGTPERE